MDKLDVGKKEVHDGQEIVAKKKIDRKHLGAGRKPFKNAILFGLNTETYEIYEVKMQSKAVLKAEGLGDTKKDQVVIQHKVYLHPDHPITWASSKRVALKKFLKLKFKV